MRYIIAGGTGFIGRALTKHFLAGEHEVTIIGRSAEKIQSAFDDTVQAVTWDQFKADPSTYLQQCDAVINLTGAGIGDKRWTEKRKDVIIASRVESTECIASACAQLGDHAPRYLNASAIGIYGLQKHSRANLPEPLTEASPVAQHDDFLSRVGLAWEAASQLAPKVTQLRFGVVLDKSGGALVKYALPFQLFVGGKIASGQQAISWISLHDLIAAIDFILARPELTGPINLVAMQAVKQEAFAHSLARALHRPCWLPMPGFVMKLLYGQLADELLLQGQHVIPERLLTAGFQFKHPDVDAAFADIYA